MGAHLCAARHHSSSTRRSIASTFNTTTSYAFTGGLLLGKLGWVVTTSALLVGLPFALAVEDESRIVAQEKEMMAQQQGAQHMLAPQAPGAPAQGSRPPVPATSTGSPGPPSPRLLRRTMSRPIPFQKLRPSLLQEAPTEAAKMSISIIGRLPWLFVAARRGLVVCL